MQMKRGFVLRVLRMWLSSTNWELRLAAILARCNVVVILISSLSVTGCPQDWVEEGSNCYRAIPDLQKAIDARNECKKLGTDLPVIKSSEENTFFLKLTEDRGETWLGMYAEMNNDFHSGWTAPPCDPWLTRFLHGLQANQTIPLTNTVLICTLTTTTTEKENGIITFVIQSTMLFVRNVNKVSGPF